MGQGVMVLRYFVVDIYPNCVGIVDVFAPIRCREHIEESEL